MASPSETNRAPAPSTESGTLCAANLEAYYAPTPDDAQAEIDALRFQLNEARQALAAAQAGEKVSAPSQGDLGSSSPKSEDTHRAAERPIAHLQDCKYCGPRVLTGLPGSACENCMGSGEDLEGSAWSWVQSRYPDDAASDLAFDANEMVDAYIAGRHAAMPATAQVGMSEANAPKTESPNTTGKAPEAAREGGV